ncbi:MAG TPA: putative glycolipid-binding domain-containing protein [Solirubrobacteraceae bacterium]|jgi:hypothetical protein
MPFRQLPASAAWLHVGARDGYEVVFPRGDRAEVRFQGATAALEAGEPWLVNYVITLASAWTARSAVITGHSTSGAHDVRIEADGSGGWRVNGADAPHLDGCVDVDLESSSLTNAFPVHRLGLEVGDTAEAPAAYVRAGDLSVERLEQRYLRLHDDDATAQRYHYTAPAFEFECELRYDEFGLVVDYPGIAMRVA